MQHGLWTVIIRSTWFRNYTVIFLNGPQRNEKGLNPLTVIYEAEPAKFMEISHELKPHPSFLERF